MTRIRALFVGNDFPYPPTSGIRQRYANVISGLARVAEVDAFFVLGSEIPGDLRVPASSGLSRVGVVSQRQPRDSVGRGARWAVSGRPLPLVGYDWPAVQDAVRAWLDGPYDVAVVAHRMFRPIGPILAAAGVGRCIVDFDNLEGSVLRHQRQRTIVSPASDDRLSPRSAVTEHMRDLVHAVDARRWDRHHASLCDEADVVLVCSELDQARLGARNAVVIPNGYELPAHAVGRPAHLAPDPVITMVGHLGYPPNLDAARFFAHDVLPRVRRRVPGASFRLVGQLDDRREALRLTDDGVEVKGHVPDVAVELEASDLVVAPLRFGGGTRIKLLEAFAHRVPAVATKVGCEGLAVDDGVHLLVGDDAETLSRNCVRLLLDTELRVGLADAAHALYVDSYQWRFVRDAVANLAEAVVAADRAAAGDHAWAASA